MAPPRALIYESVRLLFDVSEGKAWCISARRPSRPLQFSNPQMEVVRREKKNHGRAEPNPPLRGCAHGVPGFSSVEDGCRARLGDKPHFLLLAGLADHLQVGDQEHVAAACVPASLTFTRLRGPIGITGRAARR